MSLVELVVRKFSGAEVTEVRPQIFRIDLGSPLKAEDFEKVYDSREGLWVTDEVNGSLIPLDPKTLLVGKMATSPDYRYMQERAANRKLFQGDFLVDSINGTCVTDLLHACNDNEMLALIGERCRIEFVGKLRLESFEGSVLTGKSSMELHLLDLVTPLFALLRGGETRYAVIPTSRPTDAHHAFIVQAALTERGIVPGALVLVSHNPTSSSFEKLEFVDPEDLSSAEVVERVLFEGDTDVDPTQVPSFQANTVDHIFTIIGLLDDGPKDRAFLEERMVISSRQVSYYLDVASLLQLITHDGAKGSARMVSLSHSGRNLSQASGSERAKLMFKAMSGYGPLNDAVRVRARTGSLPKSRSCEIVRKYDPRLGHNTNERRSSSLRSWTKWAFEQAQNHDINIESMFEKGE